MTLTMDALFASPDHYLHSFDGGDALFVPMDRAAYHRSIFLDHRIAAAAPGSMRLPLSAVAGHVGSSRATGWIFHVAHCGSTLLARALDTPATNMVLREPLSLRQLAIGRPAGAILPLALNMVGKRYLADRPTIVKANVPVNFLLPDIAAHQPMARAIMLVLSLPDYARAILRTGPHRDWAKRVSSQLAPHIGDLSGLPDAERVAALWLAQMRAFATALVAMPQARTLDAEHFYAEPGRTLAAAAAHLHVPLDAAAISAITGGPLFTTYSKDPAQPFDNAARLARLAEMDSDLTEEIARAKAWAAARGGGDLYSLITARTLM